MIPTTLPPIPPPTVRAGSDDRKHDRNRAGNGANGVGAATGVEPTLPDSRLELRPNALRLPLTQAQKNDSAVKAIYMAYREAEIAAEEIAAAARATGRSSETAASTASTRSTSTSANSSCRRRSSPRFRSTTAASTATESSSHATRTGFRTTSTRTRRDERGRLPRRREAHPRAERQGEGGAGQTEGGPKGGADRSLVA